jgi:hypothetical protein
VSSPARLAAIVAVAAAVGGGTFAGIDFGGRQSSGPSKAPRPRAQEAPLGPVHGLMLAPLADPDGRVPTADLKK